MAATEDRITQRYLRRWGHEVSEDRWVCSPECLDAVVEPASPSPAPAAVEDTTALMVEIANSKSAPAAVDVEGLVDRLTIVLADWNSAKIPAAVLPSFKVLCAVLREAVTALSTLAADKAMLAAERDKALREKAAALGLIQGHAAIIAAAEAASAAKDERIRELEAERDRWEAVAKEAWARTDTAMMEAISGAFSPTQPDTAPKETK